MTDIESILSGISPEDMARLQNIASSVLEGNCREEKEKKKENPPFSMDNLMPIMSAIGKMTDDDDGIKLIKHLKPLLGAERQKKADEAVKFLHIMQIWPEIRGLL